MTEKYRSLAKRREELVAKSALQREQFTAMMEDAFPSGSLLANRNFLQQARKKPLQSGLMAILSVLFLRHRRLFSILASAVVALRVWSQISPYIWPLINRLKWLYRKKQQ